MSKLKATALPSTSDRVSTLADQARVALAQRTDRMFVWLLLFQWVLCVILAVWITPLTWNGGATSTHPHVWAAVFLGFLIISLPVFLGNYHAGKPITRHIIAIAQMLSSSLLIHLTGGRIETHFHVFGSLAFLAIYRDWRVLITASLVTAIDHFARGVVWPESIYGTSIGIDWRWLEHSGWVLFIDLFLIYSCWHGDKDILATAVRQDMLESEHLRVEELVLERTRELRESEERYRRASTRLLEQQVVLRNVIDNIPCVVMWKDRWGFFQGCNQTLANELGYRSVGEIVGKRNEDILPNRAEAEMLTQLEDAVMANGEVLLNREEEITKRDGTRIQILDSKVPLRNSKGEVAGLLIVTIDITERKRIEAELRRARELAETANRTKSEFLANMSHEIRTPMNGIIGLTDLLLESQLTAEQRESLSMVSSSADALLTIINDILDFSKIEAGKLDLDPAPLSLRDTIGDTVKPLAIKAHSKGLELTCDISPVVPEWVVGDAGRLRQVVTNLIANAIKFTESGEVIVRVEQLSAENSTVKLRFSVKDTGIGIPKELQSKIFEPFTQADGSTTRQYGGTGLGLTISARLVELMGGRLAIRSEPNIGSEFYFDLCVERSQVSHEKLIKYPPAKLQGASVLVVDDNATNRRVLEQTLRLWEAVPTCVDNGLSALKELHRAVEHGTPYRLVLLDAMMPVMDGFTVAQQIAQEPSLTGAAIMMLTSADRQGDSARCRELGLAAHVVKPIKTADLLQAISKALGVTTAIPVKKKMRANKGLSSDNPQKLRILLTEDNPVNQRVALGILEKMGHKVSVANHGGEAIEALKTASFDVILMDVQMPVMDGFEATKQIREVEATTEIHTPIIAMTAHAMKGDRERCLDAGMDDYLSKPVKREELARVLNSITHNIGSTPEIVLKAEPSTSRFDYQRVLALFDGDHDLFTEVVSLFLTDSAKLIEDICNALYTSNSDAVRRAAHSLKGSTGYLGSASAEDAAKKLEMAATSGDLAMAKIYFRDLEDEVLQLSESLKVHLAMKQDSNSGTLIGAS